jgi:hypothetical protein
MSEKNEIPRHIESEELSLKISILKNEINNLVEILNILRKEEIHNLDKINTLRNEIWEKQKAYAWIKQIQQIRENSK